MMDALSLTSPGPSFSSKEEAQNWLLDLVASVKEARARADLETTAAAQRAWYHRLLLRYGAAKGALDACLRTGEIADNFHRTCCEQALVALAVRVSDGGA